eukprot:UN22132
MLIILFLTLNWAAPSGARLAARVIDSPDRFEEVFDQSYIPEVSEKISRTTFR